MVFILTNANWGKQGGLVKRGKGLVKRGLGFLGFEGLDMGNCNRGSTNIKNRRGDSFEIQGGNLGDQGYWDKGLVGVIMVEVVVL